MLQFGQRAVEMLLGSAAPARSNGRHEIIPTTLVVRRSCGSRPPRQASARVRWERRHAVAATSRLGLKK